MMSRVERPMPAAFEVMSVIWMMPPISFSGTTPTMSFSSPVNMSFEAFRVSTSANLSELNPVFRIVTASPEGEMPMSGFSIFSPNIVMLCPILGVKFIVFISPVRSSVIAVEVKFIFLLISSHSLILIPFMFKILSPFCSPALAAAEFSSTLPTVGASLSTPMCPSAIKIKNAKAKLKNGPAKRMKMRPRGLSLV